MDDSGDLILIIFVSIFYLVFLGLAIFIHIFMAKQILKICGKLDHQENLWLVWVPGLQFIPLMQALKKPAWWVLLFFVPIANMIVMIMLYLELIKVAGKPDYWLLFMLFFPINIWAFYQIAEDMPQGGDQNLNIEDHLLS